MDKSKLVILSLLAIFVIATIWIIFGTHPGEQEAQTPDLTEVQQGLSYKNPDLGFELELPTGFTFNEAYVNESLGPGREIRGVEFKIPPSLATGTNLSNDSHIAFEKLSNVACTPETFLVAPQDEETVRLGLNTFTFARSSGAGAGNRYDENIYITKKGTDCFALRYFIHSTNIANYDPGTVTEFDRARLLATFDQIASTLRIY